MLKAQLVWRTYTGQMAWADGKSGLPTHYRRILDVIAFPTTVAKVAGELADYSAQEVLTWLDELETLCFIYVSRIDAMPNLLAA